MVSAYTTKTRLTLPFVNYCFPRPVRGCVYNADSVALLVGSEWPEYRIHVVSHSITHTTQGSLVRSVQLPLAPERLNASSDRMRQYWNRGAMSADFSGDSLFVFVTNEMVEENGAHSWQLGSADDRFLPIEGVGVTRKGCMYAYNRKADCFVCCGLSGRFETVCRMTGKTLTSWSLPSVFGLPTSYRTMACDEDGLIYTVAEEWHWEPAEEEFKQAIVVFDTTGQLLSTWSLRTPRSCSTKWLTVANGLVHVLLKARVRRGGTTAPYSVLVHTTGGDYVDTWLIGPSGPNHPSWMTAGHGKVFVCANEDSFIHVLSSN